MNNRQLLRDDLALGESGGITFWTNVQWEGERYIQKRWYGTSPITARASLMTGGGINI